MTPGQNFTLQVETLDHDIVKSLLELTWYHNNSPIDPRHDMRVSLSNENKTLTIANFTSDYSGVYMVQYNQLFVHPYNEDCKNEFFAIMRNHPLLKPVLFCVNIEEGDCFDSKVAQNRISISIQNLSSQENFPQNLSLRATGIVSNRKLLKHSSISWYRNGAQIQASQFALDKYYNNLSVSQELQLLNISYEGTGRYRVLLLLNLQTYFYESGYRSYYDRLVSLYLPNPTAIATEYANIYYHRGKQ